MIQRERLYSVRAVQVLEILRPERETNSRIFREHNSVDPREDGCSCVEFS